VAVHKTFRTIDIVPHVLTSLRVADPADVRVVQLHEVPIPTGFGRAFRAPASRRSATRY